MTPGKNEEKDRQCRLPRLATESVGSPFCFTSCVRARMLTARKVSVSRVVKRRVCLRRSEVKVEDYVRDARSAPWSTVPEPMSLPPNLSSAVFSLA